MEGALFAYVVLIAALALSIGVLVILHRFFGKRVDNFVNSLPPSRQIILLVLAVGVLWALLALWRQIA